MRNPQYFRGEIKGQVSFRAPIVSFSDEWIFYLAFTDTFYFQLFNEKASSPMRDNDFQPEFLLTYRPSDVSDGFALTEITLGWRHISNGEINIAQGGAADRSRGSDRFIIKARFSSRHWGLDVEAFAPTRFYAENRDIYKYLGILEIKANMRYGDHLADFGVGGLLGVLAPPYNVAKKRPTPYFRASYTYKINDYYGIYAQYFAGYGDVLYEYDYFSHRIGVGIRFVR
ncbi:phospholipase A [Helicobacter sp. 23-1044]